MPKLEDTMILQAEKEVLKKSDFEKKFKRVLDIVVAQIKRLQAAVAKIQSDHQRLLGEAKSELKLDTETLKKQVNELFVEDKVKGISEAQSEAFKGLERKINALVDKRIKEVDERFTQAEKLVRNLKGPKGEPGSPSKELIQSVVGPHMEAFQKEWREKVQEAMAQRGQPSGAHNLLRLHDASDDCDGSTTTFTHPTARHVVFVTGSDVPGGFYKPGTDYTVGRNSITLDSGEVAAPSSGANLFIFYIK